ncbi:unnamed protein product [Prorocentrum cordatum]|uniref:Uncharacterized protein n=1 Tax=Prorocentrum cordatum TaxID=2364126 RepID=A0ABN9R9R3_9DINO|nr:unnamed protein product [Polarella glacialis]
MPKASDPLAGPQPVGKWFQNLGPKEKKRVQRLMKKSRIQGLIIQRQARVIRGFRASLNNVMKAGRDAFDRWDSFDKRTPEFMKEMQAEIDTDAEGEPPPP